VRRTRRPYGIAGVLAAASALAAGTFEIAPLSPTDGDVLLVVVERSFTQDCLWEASPTVHREGKTIDVALALEGQAACDQAMTERKFEVPIGRHPAGKYVVSVRWSDGEDLGTKTLTVTKAAR